MFLRKRFFVLMAVVILTTAMGYLLPVCYTVGIAMLWLLLAATVAEAAALYSRKGIAGSRHCAERFSNGDDNTVEISLRNSFPFALTLTVTDEAPFAFQRRDISIGCGISAHGSTDVSYTLRPVRRGECEFGMIRVFATTRIGLIERRFTCGERQTVKVYPSYMALRQYEILAAHNRLNEMGIKKVRRAGNNKEFEQIKEYVKGDEYRHINWKATARRNQLMVNTYQDEKSQQMVCIIDKGRIMQQSFRGMTLLDYSINASLVLSFVAVNKEDKAGVCTFCNGVDSFVKPARSNRQMQLIQDALYKQKSTFGETDFSSLHTYIATNLNKRSLLVLFTNFTGKSGMLRQLPYLKQLCRQHRLLVVFFEDNELKEYIAQPYFSTEDYYRHVIAEKTQAEQRYIVSLLRQHGILSLLTTPENLSVDVINKYLEIRKG